MVLYRRHHAPGGTFFFTVTLADRSSRALVEHVEQLRRAWSGVRTRHPFETRAVVILPDHLHCIWRLPAGDCDHATRWRLIKTAFTARLRADGVRVSRRCGGERKLWQRRFWEHTIRDADDLQRHVDYIHFNPVKHGHVRRVVDWPYSSFHRQVREGMLPRDLAGTNGKWPSAVGE